MQVVCAEFIAEWKHKLSNNFERKRYFAVYLFMVDTEIETYVLTYLLHGAESFLGSQLVCS